MVAGGGDAMMVEMGPDTKYSGVWCDTDSNNEHKYICEAFNY